MSNIQPVPQTFPIVNEKGFYTTVFKTYLDAILKRIGGVTGGSFVRLTDQTSIDWDLDQAPVAYVVLGGNRIVANPSNPVAGNLYPYRLTLVQDATGNRTVTWGTSFFFPSGTPPTLSTGANAIDEFWFSSDGVNLYQVGQSLNLG